MGHSKSLPARFSANGIESEDFQARGVGGSTAAAPDVERLHQSEARQTGGEMGGAIGADVIRTAREREMEGGRGVGGRVRESHATTCLG
jgi:hypothetical protein